MIVDFHTHAFPDSIALRAMPMLAREANIEPALDGTVSALLQSMDRVGIARSVLCPIATQPAQFGSILRWSDTLPRDRIVPFASVHPQSPKAAAQLKEVANRGLRGIKWHPYYQDFMIDEPRLWPLYETMERLGLIVLLHCGYDIGFPLSVRPANPARLARVLDDFPGLRVVAAHLGGWKDWDEVGDFLLGRDVYFDISFSFPYIEPQKARALILGHRPDRLLFGSDSPWADPQQTMDEWNALDLPAALRDAVFHTNACRLLGVTPEHGIP